MSGEKRILIVDDEPAIRDLLRISLGNAGFVVEEVERGREAVQKAATQPPDLIVLDLGLPDMDGKEVIMGIREWTSVPILILSVRATETEKIAALDGGANDYVTKPFSTGELLARVRALLRTVKPGIENKDKFQLGNLSLDTSDHRCRLDNKDVKLTRKEFDVLTLLVRNAGRLITYKQLLSTVWGSAHLEDVHYLRIVVGHLRDKLDDDATDPQMIITEPGVGYRLVDKNELQR